MEERVIALESLQQGIAALQRGEVAAAKELLDRSCNLFLSMEDAFHLSHAYSGLGNWNRQTSNTIGAFQCYEKAGDYAATVFQQSGECFAVSLHMRAVLYAEAGKLLEAFLLLKHAATVYEITASPQVNDVKTMISRIERRFGAQQAALLASSWQSYQQALDEAAQRQLRSVSLNLSN